MFYEIFNIGDLEKFSLWSVLDKVLDTDAVDIILSQIKLRHLRFPNRAFDRWPRKISRADDAADILSGRNSMAETCWFFRFWVINWTRLVWCILRDVTVLIEVPWFVKSLRISRLIRWCHIFCFFLLQLNHLRYDLLIRRGHLFLVGLSKNVVTSVGNWLYTPFSLTVIVPVGKLNLWLFAIHE